MGMGVAIIGSALVGGLFASQAASTQAHASKEAAHEEAEAYKKAAEIQAQTADKDRAFNKWLWEEKKKLIMPWWKTGKWALDQYQKKMDHIPKFTDKVGELPAFDERLLPDFNFKFDNTNPAYQWRYQQGINALDKSAAAKGMLLSGGQLKGLEKFGQGVASQEYENAFNRSYQTYTSNRANALTKYNLNVQKNTSDWQRELQKYNIQRSNYLNALSQYGQLAGAGQVASQNLSQGASEVAANNIAISNALANAQANAAINTGRANARGTLGAAQAQAQGMYQMSGIMNNAIGNYLLYNLLGRQGMLGMLGR